ncbi:MAG: alpha/beta fold hydrolase [Desulfobacterales bacterium]|nr:alpha/beta fold hydrolase [Desulfobacterales bacterium]
MRAPATYTPPPLMKNGHVQTVFPSLFRKINGVSYTRERITTPDDDFLDLDWSQNGRRRLAIISHGLEGDSDRAYVKGMVRALNLFGWDCLAWNFRGCSGSINRRLKFYHSGSFDDLATVIEHAAAKGHYTEIVLMGFSIGGNITLLYLGKNREKVHPLVSGAAVLSVPCDLAAGADALARPANRVYMQRFLRLLHQKIKAKIEIMPGRINDRGYAGLKTFADFDNRYTAPMNGFKDAADYWQKCSSKPWIRAIKVPTLMIAAVNDPFLTPACFPETAAAANRSVYLETPESGGHVGFIQFYNNDLYWSEQRITKFFDRHGRATAL